MRGVHKWIKSYVEGITRISRLQGDSGRECSQVTSISGMQNKVGNEMYEKSEKRAKNQVVETEGQ